MMPRHTGIASLSLHTGKALPWLFSCMAVWLGEIIAYMVAVERRGVLVNCSNHGVWAFHCYILTRAEPQHGMFGMVTALIVEA